MLKDGKEVELTKEEAIDLHRQMWRDMDRAEKELGGPIDREIFKGQWCKEHGYSNVFNDCFLCEQNNQIEGGCERCLINWGVYPSGENRCCYDDLERLGDLNYEESPIRDIAEAPLKEE